MPSAMSRAAPRYDVLFEASAISPVTAKNRFSQVPHCNGKGYRDPTALAGIELACNRRGVSDRPRSGGRLQERTQSASRLRFCR